MKKKLVALTTCIVTSVCILSGCGSKSELTHDFDSETNQTESLCGVSYEVPESWEQRDVEGQGDSVLYYYPSDNNGLLMVSCDSSNGAIDVNDDSQINTYKEGFESSFSEYTETTCDVNYIADDTIEALIIEFQGVISNQNIIGKTVVFGYDGYTVAFICGNYDNSNFNYSDDFDSIIESISIGETSSNELLPFGFTGSEYYTTASSLLSSAGFTVSDLGVFSSTVTFNITAESEQYSVTILQDSDGFAENIDLSYDSNAQTNLPAVAECIVNAMKSNLSFSTLDEEIDISNLPISALDAVTTCSSGIYVLAGGERISFSRDDATSEEYFYNNSITTPATESSSSNSSEGSTSTVGEQNALSSAQSYLSVMAFSYSGLIEQLEYEGYTTDEATYAADNCNADWNEQALASAKSYLKSSAFSYTGLIEQLEYEGFSTEQATYGVDNCDADWNAQAAACAQSYINSMSFSRSELIEQLEYEGFTSEQAEYGVSAVGY